MADDLIERVARAIDPKLFGRVGINTMPFARELARAAIEAMRLNDDDWMHRDIVGNYDDLERFNWTIDAILNEKKK